MLNRIGIVSIAFLSLISIVIVACSTESDSNLSSDLMKKNDCINYNFSYDTLQLTSFSYTIGGVEKNISIANSGVNLLGSIFFQSDRFKLWIRAREVNEVDTVIYEFLKEGTFTFELDTMLEWFVNEKPKYSRYNSLNLYPDNPSETNILNIRQNISCNLPNQRWDQFFLDSLECKLRFRPFE
jgi:hypothetical protein